MTDTYTCGVTINVGDFQSRRLDYTGAASAARDIDRFVAQEVIRIKGLTLSQCRARNPDADPAAVGAEQRKHLRAFGLGYVGPREGEAW